MMVKAQRFIRNREENLMRTAKGAQTYVEGKKEGFRRDWVMSSFFDSGPLPDWKDIQQLLGKDIPWNLASNWDRIGDSDWLNKYVNDILARKKTEVRVQAEEIVRVDVTKDTNYVNLTVKLPQDMDIRRLQLFATSDRLTLIGLPGDKKRVIRFPCQINARSGKAVMKKDRLLIRFRRKPPEKSEYELFIQS
jgi:hypothetical protein